MQILIASLIAALLLFSTINLSAQVITQDCVIDEDSYREILAEVTKKNPNAIKSLPDCFKLDRKLIIKAALIDPTQFQYASDILKDDENFVNRLLQISAEILQFTSKKLHSDMDFMENATYINRDALQYADPKILNDKMFMKRMIIIDSRNYKFASNRLKEMPELASIALNDNGILLAFAPDSIKSNKSLVKIALQSNSSAIEYASESLKKDKDLQKLAIAKTSVKSKEDLEKFLEKNYLVEERGKNLGFAIANKKKFFPKNAVIDRNYITKWQKYLGGNFRAEEKLTLVAADSRNYPISWKSDLRKYPELIKKIENFFLNHNVDQNTIDNLSLTYFWKIKDAPQTFAFNLYLLRDSRDVDLGNDFSDITSLSAIAQKHKNKWHFTVVEVIFDSETRTSTSYTNGHKRYILWDLYKADSLDKNPKIIFKVEDKFNDYFEIFEEQAGGKYQIIYRIEPDLKKTSKKSILD